MFLGSVAVLAVVIIAWRVYKIRKCYWKYTKGESLADFCSQKICPVRFFAENLPGCVFRRTFAEKTYS